MRFLILFSLILILPFKLLANDSTAAGQDLPFLGDVWTYGGETANDEASGVANPGDRITPALRRRFLELGGNPRALNHMACIKENYIDRQQTFSRRRSRFWMRLRCNRGGSDIQIERRDVAVLVDYTSPPENRRYFEINFAEQTVNTYYVSHGRNGRTNRGQRRADGNSNGVRDIPQIFSNEIGSNASSTGLFVAGHRYWGRWGTTRGKRSMVLHGLERDVNDNACDRATVIHGNSYIRERGSNQGTHRMSSGCPMLDYNVVNERIEAIRGEDAQSGGAAYFVYGPREQNLPEDYYCRRNSSVRVAD